jgi:monofunctional biosynthetic peptidoglycan transglycosylase
MRPTDLLVLIAAALGGTCSAMAAPGTTRLTDPPSAWRIVNDGVMGGVSESRVGRVGDALRFEGEIRLDYSGGFASMRRPFEAAGAGDAAGFLLRVRGDGNRYRLRLYTRDAAGGENRHSHYAVFDTRAGEVTAVELRWPQFAASFRGRAVDAPPIRAADLLGIGVMITKDDHRQGRGPFALDLLDIEPLR